MIPKVKNLSIETTDEQDNLEWIKVLSYRNRLLQSTDWTQLADIYMPDEQVKSWQDWRDKLRKINKENCKTPQFAQNALEQIEISRPKFNKSDIRYKEEESKYPRTQSLPEPTSVPQIIHRVEKIIQEPIVLHEKISDADFRYRFKKIFEENPIELQHYLLSIMKDTFDIVILENEDVEISRKKLLDYLKEKQRIILADKLKELPEHNILKEREAQALDYLSSENSDLENFPLIQMYANVYNQTFEEVSTNFLLEKKKFNQIIFEAERFLVYNTARIHACETTKTLRELLVEIKNGY